MLVHPFGRWARGLPTYLPGWSSRKELGCRVAWRLPSLPPRDFLWQYFVRSCAMSGSGAEAAVAWSVIPSLQSDVAASICEENMLRGWGTSWNPYVCVVMSCVSIVDY